MPSSVTITPRKIFLEDLELSTSTAPSTSNQYVGGLGTVPLTPISAVLYSAFGAYSNDTTAAAGGIALGQIYYNTTSNALFARRS
jgi:hypothetical protein